MRIAICDDEAQCIQSLQKTIDLWSSARGISMIQISGFTSSEELLEDWSKQPCYDVFFLDIDMPQEMNGLELAHMIRKGDEQAVIIFVTNFSYYASEGYRVNALRFLCKPFEEMMVFESMDIAYRQWKACKERVRIPIRLGAETVVIYAQSIGYIEVRGHHLEIHRMEPDAPVIVRMRLEDLLIQLPETLFVRCHRSFAVNLNFVHRITRTEIELVGGKRLPLGDRFVIRTNNAFVRFFQGGEE